MPSESRVLLQNAIQFLFTYFKFKSIYPELMPEFCANMPDDELLMRAMLYEDELQEFSEEFNYGSAELAVSTFFNLIRRIEYDLKCSLKERKFEKIIKY